MSAASNQMPHLPLSRPVQIDCVGPTRGRSELPRLPRRLAATPNPSSDNEQQTQEEGNSGGDDVQVPFGTVQLGTDPVREVHHGAET